MDDVAMLEDWYKKLYQALQQRDVQALADLMDDSFCLTHATGMRQNKTQFVRFVETKMLRYYDQNMEQLDITLAGDAAHFTGKGKVLASLFGCIKRWWNLQFTIQMKREEDGRWCMVAAMVK